MFYELFRKKLGKLHTQKATLTANGPSLMNTIKTLFISITVCFVLLGCESESKERAAEPRVSETTVSETTHQNVPIATKDKSRVKAEEDYDDAVADLARLVKAGEITREQMQEELALMRSLMNDEWLMLRKPDSDDLADDMIDMGEEAQKIISDHCMALRRRLAEGVRNGDLTDEESKKVWEREGC